MSQNHRKFNVYCICAFKYSVHIFVKPYLTVTEDLLKYYVYYLPTHIFSHSLRALKSCSWA